LFLRYRRRGKGKEGSSGPIKKKVNKYRKKANPEKGYGKKGERNPGEMGLKINHGGREGC